MGEIVDANTIRMASNMHVGRASSCQYSYALPPPPGRIYVPSKKKSSFSWWNSSEKKSSCAWWNSAETKRKKRVAAYKFYAAEGRAKASFKHGFRWMKNTCSRIVHGF